MNSQVLTIDDSPTPTRLFWQGTVAMLPLSIAVLPWGLLAGSFAIEAGLSVVESQALSAVLYAGAAQLVAIGMFKTGAGLLSLLIATFLLPHAIFCTAYQCAAKSAHYPCVGG